MNARARDGWSYKVTCPVLRLRNNLIARAELLGKVANPIAPLANAVLSNGAIRWAMEKVLSIHRSAPLPKFSGERFTSWFENHKPVGDAHRKVVYFHGCSSSITSRA
jgi:glycerol-3-phosphate dehydrogenase subunit C